MSDVGHLCQRGKQQTDSPHIGLLHPSKDLLALRAISPDHRGRLCLYRICASYSTRGKRLVGDNNINQPLKALMEIPFQDNMHWACRVVRQCFAELQPLFLEFVIGSPMMHG